MILILCYIWVKCIIPDISFPKIKCDTMFTQVCGCTGKQQTPEHHLYLLICRDQAGTRPPSLCRKLRKCLFWLTNSHWITSRNLPSKWLDSTMPSCSQEHFYCLKDKLLCFTCSCTGCCILYLNWLNAHSPCLGLD